jgi:hypothetical protein
VLPPSPTDGAGARAGFAARADLYITYVACRQEDRFLHDLELAQVTTKDKKQLINGADNTDHVLLAALAKLKWLKSHPTLTECVGDFPISQNAETQVDDYIWSTAHSMPYLSGPCASVTGIRFSEGTTGQLIHVTRECLTSEVNYALRAIQRGYALPGTDGLPCNLYEAGAVKGDWDMRMKILIRAVLLDQQQSQTCNAGPILSAVVPIDNNLIFAPVSPLSSVEGTSDLSTRDYILQQLITVDGHVGDDSYSWAGCGDNEYATGSPQDREDSHEGADNFWNSLGDIFSWFLRRIVPILAVAGIAVTLAALGLDALVVLTLTAVALAAILTTQIPEPENHRLMIESTRFLNNQTLIDSLGPNNAPKLQELQGTVKSWLLTRFQQIAKSDFTEYNARPYHGFSLEALRNLADFAEDADVRTGAQMLVDFSAAKYALGSNQGRRQIPFRRHFAVVDCLDGRPCPEIDDSNDTFVKNSTFSPMFDDFVNLGDADVAEGTLFLGLREQLPNATPKDALIRYAIAASTVNFLPPDFITDLAVTKSTPFVQRIHHATYEAYSSGPSVLISAGGIEGPHAAQVNVPGFSLAHTDDLGAGTPTSLMFPSNSLNNERASLDRFFSFRGSYDSHGDQGTFTHNLCVDANFACGTNLQIPADAAGCLTAPASAPGNHRWLFMDSRACAPYADSPHFYLTMYVVCEAGIDCKSKMAIPVPLSGTTTAGLIEIVDINDSPTKMILDPALAFSRFQDKVLKANPPNTDGEIPGLGAGCLTGGSCTGTYHSMNYWFSKVGVQVDLRGHEDDANSTGILSIDGAAATPLGSWPFADGESGGGKPSGPILQSAGDGVITVQNPHLGRQLILDFSDATRPCHRDTLGGPCVQD